MDVDVPLACKLDVIAGPCSGRGYINTEDVLEASQRRSNELMSALGWVLWCLRRPGPVVGCHCMYLG